MRLVAFSQTGYSVGIASFLSSEGHATSVYIHKELDMPFVIRTVHKDTPDIVIFDSPTFAAPADEIRSRGIRVLGASQWSELLSNNQEYQDDLIKAIGYTPYKDENGIDAIVTCWFNGQRFISKSLVFNYDKMMSNNVGASVGSSGYIVYFTKSKLVDDVVTPLEKFLRKANHRGCFSVSVTITDGPDALIRSISADITQPYTQAIFENTRRSRSDLLLDLFNETSTYIPTIEPYVCGVQVSVYPYPYTSPKVCTVEGISPSNLKHMWIVDLSQVKDDWVCGAGNGCMGYVTARGTSVQEAQRRVYRTIKNIKSENIQYRNDIGKDVGEKMYYLRQKHLI